MREIVLDTETTGLFTHEGERLIEVCALELINGVPTGQAFHAYINPERLVPQTVKNGQGQTVPTPHGLTDAFLADKPLFKEIAREFLDFVGNDPIIITCRTEKNGYVLDVAFINMELAKAGEKEIPEEQWINVRKWSETMYGNSEASLNKMLDRYGIARGARGDTNHGARLDTQLLAELYPKLKKDYFAFITRKAPAPDNPPAP